MICEDNISDKLITMKLSNAQDEKVDMVSRQSYMRERVPSSFPLLTLETILQARDRHNIMQKLSSLCDPSVTSSVQLDERRGAAKRPKQPPTAHKKPHRADDIRAFQRQPPIKLQPMPIKLQPMPIELQPMPVKLEPRPVKLEPRPIKLEPTPAVALGPARMPAQPAPTADLAESQPSRGSGSPPPKKKYPCDLCDKSFDYKHVLQNHNRTHTGEKPYECELCQKRFTRDHHLKTHMRLHTGEKPFKCDVCGKRFVQVANLRRHERVHTGERPFQCPQCSARFSDSNQLKAHELVHTDIMPYSCELCGYRYRRKHHGKGHRCGRTVRRRLRQPAAAAAECSSGTPSPAYSSSSPSPASAGSSNGSSAANNNNDHDEDRNGAVSDFGGASPQALTAAARGAVKLEDGFNNNGYHFLRRPCEYWSQYRAQFSDGSEQDQPEDLSVKK